MTKPDAQIRHANLVRAERAAGEAFGWPEGPVPAVRRPLLFSPTTLAAATAATAFAATLSYLV